MRSEETHYLAAGNKSFCTAQAVASSAADEPEYSSEIAMIIDVLKHIDYVPLPLPPSTGLGQVLVLDDNEAVLKMCCKGRSNQMRHVVRTQRTDIERLFERIRDVPGVFMKYSHDPTNG